jgi:predicted nucleic acid-binding protein
MILVNTSAWIDHFNNSNRDLVEQLHSSQVCIHPFIIGELSCGNITNRKEILSLLRDLPTVDAALNEEVFELIEKRKLYGKGLGFIDVHLLASFLIHDVMIWTRETKL